MNLSAHRRARLLPFLGLLLASALAPAAGAADPVVFEVTTTQDGLLPGTAVPGQPGVHHPVPESLRWASREANQTAPGAEVIVRLQADTTYPIEHPKVWEGINTKDEPALDPSHGDLEITRSFTLEGRGATWTPSCSRACSRSPVRSR